MSRDVCHDRFIYLEKRINELSDDLSELREAKAAPQCTGWSGAGRCALRAGHPSECFTYPREESVAPPPAPPSLHSKPSECPTCGPGCYEQGQVPPPAPPFVLGPKTMAKFALIGSNVEIIQMAALLIAEWLLAESANEAVHAWADRILRGDWGKK